jgi:hypothetical protein
MPDRSLRFGQFAYLVRTGLVGARVEKYRVEIITIKHTKKGKSNTTQLNKRKGNKREL